MLPVTYPTGTDFEKTQMDARHLRQRFGFVLRQPGDREHPGGTAYRHVRDRRPDAAQELRRGVRGARLSNGSSRGRAGGRLPRPTRSRWSCQAGEEKVLTQTIAIPNARLWSPEDPFLYVLETATGGDSLATRFGMREFRFDATTRRFYLNGKVLLPARVEHHAAPVLRGPDCGRLPWNDAWVRKLLVEIPKRMHWNSFRFCIGPVPDRWLEIADEAGLLIQNEFFIWTGAPGWDRKYARHWDVDEMVAPIWRLDARQLEPPERGHLGRQQRNAGPGFRRQDHPGRARVGPIQPALGKQL